MLFIQRQTIHWNGNRPTGGVAAAILFFNLHLNPHRGRTFKEHMQDLDFIGLFLIVAGVVLLLLGFNESETSCRQFPLCMQVCFWLISIFRVFCKDYLILGHRWCIVACLWSERERHNQITYHPTTLVQGKRVFNRIGLSSSCRLLIRPGLPVSSWSRLFSMHSLFSLVHTTFHSTSKY